MGWFVEDVEGVAVHKVIFVPEWGWVGSGIQNFRNNVNKDFRPRLGMSWFRNIIMTNLKNFGFSSPSGDGLVLDLVKKTVFYENFRPRVGMGWFNQSKE